MAIIDRYNKSTLKEKNANKQEVSGFDINQQPGNRGSIELTKFDKLQPLNTNGGATAPYNLTKKYSDSVKR
jgi:hypothetical protein